jgi:hypothetical protein
MMLVLLLACGGGQQLDQPNPPPSPPPVLTTSDPGVVVQTGLVTDVHGATRTCVITGEGRRLIVHFKADAAIRLGGQPASAEDIQAGTTLHVEGQREGDLLVAMRAWDGDDATGDTPVVPAVAPVADPGAPTPEGGAVAPAAPADAPAEAPAEAPSDTPASEDAPAPG